MLLVACQPLVTVFPLARSVEGIEGVSLGLQPDVRVVLQHQKHYQANVASPLYSEVRNIVLKTVGLAEPLRDALKPVSSAIRAAFVYGSVAKATDQSGSDIDLMIISDSLTYGEVFGALERVTRALGRTINPTVYTAVEFSRRARKDNAFVTRVIEQPKFWVIGSDNDLPVAA
jgi:predicted nucleotidyltransferase